MGCASRNCWTKHNWIHHNTLSRVANADPCTEGVDAIKIGAGYSPVYSNGIQDDYNTIEYNQISYVAHTPIDSYGGYTVIAGNVIHNEG